MRGTELITDEVITKTTDTLKTVIADFFPQQSGWFFPPTSVTKDVIKLELPDGIGTVSIIVQYLEEDNKPPQ